MSFERLTTGVIHDTVNTPTDFGRHFHKEKVMKPGSVSPRAVQIEFVTPGCAAAPGLGLFTMIYARFNGNDWVYLLSFDQDYCINKIQKDELTGKSQDEIRILVGQRIGFLPKNKPKNSEVTHVTKIIHAEILESIHFKDGAVVELPTTHVLRVECIGVRGKILFYNFNPDEFNPELTSKDFTGLTFREAVSLLEKRRV
ncbi:MAG: hypothetical protein CL685_00150 [Candidatus Magasanikbacteria bacterium]|nr:hypothetical protein [Candidatus Magasanikbacteria bacterium]